jgi:ABC-type phosphate transport system permease subunit
VLAGILGLPVTWTLHPIVLRSATPGIVTGPPVAIAVSISQTAPLFITHPVWTLHASPYEAQQYLAC